MRWIEPAATCSPFPDLHPLIGQTLARRGVTTPEARRAFLDPEAYVPTPPGELPGLESAAGRIWEAVHRGEQICVWGDFDVDGQTATAILVETLRGLQANVLYHIPVRSTESHGIRVERLEEVIAAGARLILTCDTGISAFDAVARARAHGVDVIITDHHDLPPRLPAATAIVNPKLLPDAHPLVDLSGSGVAYKLAESLLAGQDSAILLDLTALGLVADLARLRGDSRYLVQQGLVTLRKTGRLGLKAMMDLAELAPANLNEEHIGFVFGPRLNALGRLGDANPAVELLTTANPERARLLAAQLENYNAQRQLLCSQVTQAAEAQLRANPDLLTTPVIVLGHPTWPGGVVGIVASRLVERYHKPAILFFTPPGEAARGSARSIQGLNITTAIAIQKDLLLTFGGHPMAAGLALDPQNLPEFRRRLGQTVEKMLAGIAAEPVLQIDGWVGLSEVTLDLARRIDTLAPFGPGNEKLVLAARDLRLESVTEIGRNHEHRKLTVVDGTANTQTVLWWDSSDQDLPEGHFDLAFSVRISDWRGARQAQMTFIACRRREGEVIEIQPPAIRVEDHRQAGDQLRILRSLSPETLVWSEGEQREAVGGLDRNSLGRSARLAIWTTPPGPEVLQAVLEKVRPQTVDLFRPAATVESQEGFLDRLVGLLKYVLHQRGGKTSYSELAAATAQRETLVRKAITWMVARGKIKVIEEDAGTLVLETGTVMQDPAGAAQLWMEIESLLAETEAYRAHFQRAEADSLIH
ncbi:MAG: single-stranded-DNA-specific exonuclease RecJ [Anaerolineales bacterium]|nr:single-stranded-DNA-specific exonuclease RecJ [Anaerolineales bacterium]